MLTQEAIFIATIKGTSLVIKTRPLGTFSDHGISRFTIPRYSRDTQLFEP